MKIRREGLKRLRTSFCHVLARFPEHRSSLEKLWEDNAYFQSLCEEYDDCVAALNYWQLSDGEEAGEYRDEYAALVLELEAEILEYLEDSEKESMIADV